MLTLDRRSLVLLPRWPAALRLLGYAREPGPAEDAASMFEPAPIDAKAPGDNPHARRADRVLREVDQEHGQILLGLAIRSGLAHDAAEDAVQEAMFRLWQEVRKGVDIIDPRAWTFRTLYRIAMDEHRIRRRTGDVLARLSTRSWKTLDPDIAQRISIWSLVDRLPTRQRQVLYLRYKADLSFDQIAATLGITASAARAHATFAGARLRSAIGTEWDR
jgi:RNA polymerase sigma factor (sigma-70 family)